MMRGTLTFVSFISVIFFPWPFTVLLVLVFSYTEPLMPLAIGTYADTLYYSSSVGTLPLFTLYGAIATLIVFFVRSRLRTSIIKR